MAQRAGRSARSPPAVATPQNWMPPHRGPWTGLLGASGRSIAMNSTSAGSPPAGRTMDTWLSHAEQLLGIGLPVVPLCQPVTGGGCSASSHEDTCRDAGKRPLVAGYPSLAHQVPDRDQASRVIMKFLPCNLGIVVPAGLVVVEADSPAAEEEVSLLAGGETERAPTRERRPGRGRGWLFRLALGTNVLLRTHLGASAAIDVLPAGSIFVVPPSVHRSGHAYAWVSGREPWKTSMPLLPAALLSLAREGARPPSQASGDFALGATFAPRVSSRVAFLLKSRRRLAALWNGEGKTCGDTSSSGIDFSLAIELRAAGVPVPEVAEALAARPGAHSSARTYCMTTAQRATGRKP